jgi:eukaryotic-like serine/threonine-protein kinase
MVLAAPAVQAGPSAQAAPSPSDRTLTLTPLEVDPVPPVPRPVAPTQVRDPERYQVIAEHGRGGLGRVSRAHDLELGRDVAIKELLSRSRENQGRFLREALITARLEHPGIVPVHEAGQWPDGTPFYAMKLVSGRPLRNLIVERTTVEERIGLLHHVIAVADAIAYAHDRNIIHRDLKPDNVIVGDFGETIVIDWGLAKDLTAKEDASGGPFRSTPADELTATGGILGTPGYMAPEQRRGEDVDQRADVFAIGAMLWELCVLERVPRAAVDDHHRTLRRAGIDPDLATIIEKALAPEPKRRYPDAGALAADLKAFKSGARITARSYSLPALLAHWIRRHRAFAISTCAALVVVATSAALYVRNIAVERRIAERAQASAERAQASAEAALNELTLKHAQLLLTTDPSAAIDTLATYRGADLDRANQIRAEARGLGVAVLRTAPHGDNIRWVEGTSDGTIISLSTDGTISRTSPDQASVVFARGVSPRGRFSYAASRGLLAYACDPSDLCLWDVHRGIPIPLPQEFHGLQLAGIAFSPSGARLALISQVGVLRVFDITTPAQPVEQLRVDTKSGVAILFINEDTLAVATQDGLEIERMSGGTRTLRIPDPFLWDVGASGHLMALATMKGEGLLVDTSTVQVTSHATLCRDSVSGLKFLPGQRVVAYSCREGTIGTWDLQTGAITPLAHIEGHADMIAASKSGDYLIAAGGNGTLTVIDLSTHLITSYKGHRSRLTTISPPTQEYPFFISADVRGAIRAWPLPGRIASVAANVHTRFVSAAFSHQDTTIVATTFQPEINIFSPSRGLRSAGPHITNATFISTDEAGNAFATYGSSETVEVWSLATISRTRVLDTHQGAVAHLEFLDSTGEFITAGRDGRLIQWAPSGTQKLLAQLEQPIANFALARATASAVISTADGALWRSGLDGQVLPLRSAGTPVTRMLAFPDKASVGVGYANGDVVLIDTKSWRQTLLLHTQESVRDIALTSDGQTIAVAANDDTVHVGVRHGDTWNDANIAWVTLALRTRRIALAPDGLLVAICTDGTVWLYSSSRKTWLCLPTGTSDLSLVAVSSDGQASAVFDADGRIVWIDLKAAHSAIDGISVIH